MRDKYTVMVKYLKMYWKIIDKAKARVRIDGEYYERHHVIPKAIYTGDVAFRDVPSNVVYLTPKEHYICHHLLTKFTEGKARRSMLHAWLLMTHCDKVGKRYVPAVQYDYLRRELAKAGKSPEHRKKLSEAALRRKRSPFSEQAKKNMSEARRKDWANGKYTNQHHKGKPKSEEQKKKMAEAAVHRHERERDSDTPYSYLHR